MFEICYIKILLISHSFGQCCRYYFGVVVQNDLKEIFF